MMSELLTFSTLRTLRMKAVSSGDWLKTWRKGERRRWNMNWGYILKLWARRKLDGSSFCYVSLSSRRDVRDSLRIEHISGLTFCRPIGGHHCH